MNPAPAILVALACLAGCAGPDVDREELERSLRGGVPVAPADRPSPGDEPEAATGWTVTYGVNGPNPDVFRSARNAERPAGQAAPRATVQGGPSLSLEGYRVVRGNTHCDVVTIPQYKLEWVSDEDPLEKLGPAGPAPLPKGWEPTLPPPTVPPQTDRPTEPKGTLIHVGPN